MQSCRNVGSGVRIQLNNSSSPPAMTGNTQPQLQPQHPVSVNSVTEITISLQYLVIETAPRLSIFRSRAQRSGKYAHRAKGKITQICRDRRDRRGKEQPVSRFPPLDKHPCRLDAGQKKESCPNPRGK